MRVNKNFTLDHEIILKLQKVDNASELVNGLLIKHFDKTDLTKMSLPELKKLKATMMAEEEHKTKLEVINGKPVRSK